MGFHRMWAVSRSRLVLAAALLACNAPLTDSPSGERREIAAHTAISELVGTEVMISFKWQKPTSVVGSLVLVGMLVGVEDDVLIVSIERSPRTEASERALGFLESERKLQRDDRNPSIVRVFRNGIERVSRYPKL